MRVGLIAVGRLKAGPERDLAARYVTRFDALAPGVGLSRLDVREIDASRARRAGDRQSEEAEGIAALLPDRTRLALLDERGRALGSAAFAQAIAGLRDAGGAGLTFVIGGPDGAAAGLREQAYLSLAFGSMTWPHQLVRVMLAEQLYRAATILSGHPYHRA